MPAHLTADGAYGGGQAQKMPASSVSHEHQILDRLRQGDEAAFVALVEQLGPAMLRLARLYTGDQAIIEDAIQDAWLGVLRGLPGFQERASLRTWICRILINRLRSRLKRDGRMVPFSSLFDAASASSEPAVEPERFLGEDHPRWPRHWKEPPQRWGESPEEQLLSAEARAQLNQVVALLPPAQREVITLRDIEGWRAEEVCNLLEITETNQRVLLHRARSRVRRALERYFTEE
ncbi:MAG TPA: RNA polymerase sigma factor [Gemmatimonadaceae bacterium]|nr:RNA polymerase sigma factor [Gemmatimonadaceae bacterium]